MKILPLVTDIDHIITFLKLENEGRMWHVVMYCDMKSICVFIIWQPVSGGRSAQYIPVWIKRKC